MDNERDAEKDFSDSVFPLHSCSDNLLIGRDVNVKNLQEILFPITPRKTYSAESYLSSTYLKKVHLREEEEKKINDAIFKARDSKELFSKDLAPNEHVDQPPRWPTECQVLDERIKHIPYKPCPPEPYYAPTGDEVQPKPIGEEAGIIVYQYYPISPVNYFCRSSVGGSKYLMPTCPSPEIESLRFESRFESGNLAKAIKITANYYELYLRTDMYTNRHMQWFYFRITNMRKNCLYRFSIVNFTKGDSLFAEGMQPLMYSEKDAQLHSIGWRRCGSNIAYFCNDNCTEEDTEQIRYYTLTFTTEFPHENDVIYIAHSYPYTYSDLQDYLLSIATHPIKSTYTTLRLLCKTLAGNNVYYVTVTSPPNSETCLNKKKKAIVITARVHPGETPSSWMMHGFLDFLTSETGPAKELRDNFIFKLVPMLNPDGVIVGNNRCSLTGKDLNRQYRTVIRETYPSIWYTKLMIRRLVEDCGVAMYCDLHAHSKKHNIFIFGCENKRAMDKKLYEQVFPLMLHKNASDKFSFENCKFRIQKCKEGTGRVVMWMMGIANSFTMEASFGGTSMGTRKDTHFNTVDYEQMGKTFCQTLLDFYDEDPRKERLRMKIINRLAKEGSNADEPANIRLSDYSRNLSDGGDTTTSSDNEVERPRIIALPTTAPPPTPVKVKKIIPRPMKNSMKSPNRKLLDVGRANLVFSANNNSSDESSLSDSELEVRKGKRVIKRKKKKTKKKISKKLNTFDILDSDIRFGRNYAVIDLMPETKLNPKQYKRDFQQKIFVDHKRQTNHERLLEVQTKLLALKNKLWFGVGDVDSHKPLCWSKTTNQGYIKSASAKIEKTQSFKKPAKSKEETKENKQIKNSKNNLKRQTAVEFAPLRKPSSKIRKTKSFTDIGKKEYKQRSTYKVINLSAIDKEEEVHAIKPKGRKTKTKPAKFSTKTV